MDLCVFGLLRLLFPTVFAWLRDVVHPTLLKDTWSVNSPFRRNKTHFWYTVHPCMASKDSTTLGSHPLLHPNSGTLMIKFNSISRFKSSFHQMTNFPPLSLFSIFFFHPRICTYGMVTLQKLVFNRHFLPNPSYLWEKTTMDGMKF